MNRTTRYEYDQLGRRSKRILPLGQVETYSYQIDGSLQAKTDFNGKTTTFAYDNMRRLISKTPDASLNQPSISFTYNDLGQRATMTDASGTTAYSYDTRNRLQSKQTPFGTLSYGYDNAGNIQTLRSSNANGVSVDYSYDELNRLSAAKDNRLVGNQTTTYTFDAVGNLQSYAYPNQVTTSYAYNDLNRLTAMTVSNQLGGLQSYAFTLGATGNRTKVVEASGRTVDYVYDDLYRLTSETIANSQNNGQITYQFDAVGNRLQRNSSVNGVANQSPTYDNNDRLNSDVYDNNGSTKVSNGKTYEYDFENRLTSVSNGITIVYDGDGNRVSKTVGGVTTHYLVDTNNLTGYAQVVEEIQSNAVVRTYTYGLDLISQRTASGVNFYQYDGHGSVRGLTDTSASLTDTYSYDAFGTVIEQTGTTTNNYLYAGEQFDPDLGLYYNRARYLNVGTGRFWSMDSYEGRSNDPLSLHKYNYANASPVSNLDPSGMMTLIEKVQVLLTNYTLTTLTAASNGIFFLSRNLDKIEYWWNWIELGLTGAQIVGDIAGQAGSVEFDVPNSSPTGRTGVRGEEVWLRELENRGFTDVVQVQNAQGNGIDVVARDPKGLIHAFEVKSTTGDVAPPLTTPQGDPDVFIRTRLDAAARAQGRYQNIRGTDVQAAAIRYRDEINNGASYRASKVSVFLPQSGATVPRPSFLARIRLSQWTRRR